MGGLSKRGDMIVHEERPYNAEPPRTALARRTLTPVDSFYCRNHGDIPGGDPGTWRLVVDGLVQHRLEFTPQQLRREFPEHSLVATLQCAGNRRAGLAEVREIPGEDPWGPGATGTAEWTGVRLRDVLAAAGVLPQAEHVAFTAPDVSDLANPPQRFGGSIDIAKASSDEVLLAWGMNGHPLPREHGAPLRAVVPGHIGARSVKWLERITARREPSRNFFQATSYRLLPPEADPSRAGPGDGLALGPIALNSDVLEPADGRSVPAGPVEVTGYALAGGDREVARVDVSADGGRSWQQAELLGQPTRWAWTHWRTTLQLPPGTHEVTARAWDTCAATQPEQPGPLWNPKGYVNNSWARIRLHAD